MSTETPATGATQETPNDAPWVCVTCGHPAIHDYCSHCGEKRRETHDFSLRHILGEAAEAFFHVDSKILLSLKTLLSKPGRLTAEFFAGRRKPYMLPLQTFFVCNLIFFVLQPLTGLEILGPPLRAFDNSFLRSVVTPLVHGRLAKKHVSLDSPVQYEEFAARFDQVSHLQAKSLVLIMVPMLAVVLAFIHFRPRRFFSEHLVFALHAYAWWLLWLLGILTGMGILWIVMGAAGHPLSPGALDWMATLLEFGGFGVYLFFAQRTFYRQSPMSALAKSLALVMGVYCIFHLYRLLLLFTVLYAM